MDVRIHSRLKFKYQKADSVCPSFFPTSEVFEITDFTEFCRWKSRITDYRLRKSRVTADTEFTNHGWIFSVFPNHALNFCRIPNHAEPLPDPVKSSLVFLRIRPDCRRFQGTLE